MPRNASGTYTLPSGNPVVAGTTIEASWANTTLPEPHGRWRHAGAVPAG